MKNILDYLPNFGTPPTTAALRHMEEVFNIIQETEQPVARPPQTTIVGDLVQKMDRTYRAYTERADRLTASIADMQEQLRQTRVTMMAIEAAMVQLADEVVLTPDERKAAKAASDVQFDEAVERELIL